MKAIYKKQILQDSNNAENNYENFILTKDTEFCCEPLQSFSKKFTVWDYDKGKFAIVNEITYEGHSTTAIDFCPFCGEKIEYLNTDSSKKARSKYKSL